MSPSFPSPPHPHPIPALQEQQISIIYVVGFFTNLLVCPLTPSHPLTLSPLTLSPPHPFTPSPSHPPLQEQQISIIYVVGFFTNLLVCPLTTTPSPLTLPPSTTGTTDLHHIRSGFLH